jgi:hypothetical protein
MAHQIETAITATETSSPAAAERSERRPSRERDRWGVVEFSNRRREFSAGESQKSEGHRRQNSADCEYVSVGQDRGQTPKGLGG